MIILSGESSVVNQAVLNVKLNYRKRIMYDHLSLFYTSMFNVNVLE
jgi:hypothetical protein